MSDVYQETVIRFHDGGLKTDDQAVTIGIERSRRPHPFGRDYSAVKTGPWVVKFSNSDIMSSTYMPAEVIPDIVAALEKHAAECVRRNNPVLVPDEDAAELAAAE